MKSSHSFGVLVSTKQRTVVPVTCLTNLNSFPAGLVSENELAYGRFCYEYRPIG